MDLGNWLLKLYLSEQFLQTAFVATVFAATIGHFVDKVMDQQSFGIIVNTCVVLLAIAMGASMTNARIHMLFPDDTLRISLVATFAGCGILLMTASLRRWLRDYV